MKTPEIRKGKSLFADHVTNTGSFAVAYFYFDDYPYLHNHDYWEFSLVTKGSYKQLLNNEAKPFQKYNAYLLRPSIDYHQLNKTTSETCHIVLRILDESLHKVCDFLSPTFYDELLQNPPPMLTLEISEMQKIIECISRIKTAPMAEQKTVFNYLLMYVVGIIFNQKHPFKVDAPTWFTNLLIQINSPNNINWTIDDVLQNSPYSHNHLLRYFNEYENTSIVGYLTRTKMLHAKDLLLYTSSSVLNIAYKLGFSDSSHFDRAFKKFYGITPSQYRASKHNNSQPKT